jgi:hypothetical protein
MNEIEAQVKAVEERTIVLPIVLKWFLVVMVASLVMNYFDLGDKYYQGEELSMIVITIKETPEFIDGGKSGPDRFAFKSVEHSSRFWIMGGALTIVFTNGNRKEAVIGLKEGQQVILEIHKSDLDFLKQSNMRIPVEGLRVDNKLIIDPKQVMQEDAKSIRLNLIICSVLFFLALVGLSWKRIKNVVS